MFMRGIAGYLGNFPEEFYLESMGNMSIEKLEGLVTEDASSKKWSFAYIVGFVFFFILGTFLQYKWFPTVQVKTLEEIEDDDEFKMLDSDAEEDTNNKKCCGCF